MVPLLPQLGQLIPARRARLNFTATHLHTGNAHFKGGHFPTKPGLRSPAPSLPGQGTKYTLGLLFMQGPEVGTPHSAHANSRLRPHTGDSGKDHVRKAVPRLYLFTLAIWFCLSPSQRPLPIIQDSPRQAPRLPTPTVCAAVCSLGLE